MATDKLPERAEVEVEEDRRARAVQKKPYRAPLLTAYGHIAKLTMGGAGTGTDGGKVGMRMTCL